MIPTAAVTKVPMIDEANNNLREISFGKQNFKSNKIMQSLPKSTPLTPSIDSWLNQLSSPHETARLNAYQQIIAKCPVTRDAIYRIKAKAIRECSPVILKVIIQIIKKYSTSELIDLDSLEFLCMHDWKKCRALFTEFIQTNKFTFAAQDYIKNNISLFSNIIKTNSMTLTPTPSQVFTIKNLTLQLQNLIHKFSNPQK